MDLLFLLFLLFLLYLLFLLDLLDLLDLLYHRGPRLARRPPFPSASSQSTRCRRPWS